MMVKGLIRFGFIALVFLAAIYWIKVDRISVSDLNPLKPIIEEIHELSDPSTSLFDEIDLLIDSSQEEDAFTKLISMKDSVLLSSDSTLIGNWHYRMAFVHKSRKSVVETASHLDSALKYFLNQPNKIGDVYFTKGLVQIELKQDLTVAESKFTSAIEHYSSATSPNYLRLSDTFYTLFKIANAKGELESTRQYIIKALNAYFEAEKYDAVRLGRLYVGQGFCFYSLNQYPQAMSAFEKALGIYATDSERYYSKIRKVEINLGTVYMELGMSEKALLIYENILEEKDPAMPLDILYHNMGLAHERLGNFESSLSFLEKARKAVSRREGIDSEQKMLEIDIDQIEVFRKMGRFEMAMTRIDDLIHHAIEPYSLEEILGDPTKGQEMPLGELQKALYLKGNIYVGQFEKDQEDASKLSLALETFENSARLGDILRLNFTWKEDLLAFNSCVLSVEAESMGSRSKYPQAVTCAYQLYEITQNPEYLAKAHLWMERKKIVAWWASLESSWNQYVTQIPEERKILGDSLRRDLEEIELEIKQRKSEHEAIISLETQRQVLASDYKIWKTELIQDYPGITSQLLKNEIVSLPTIQKSLKKDDPTLLSYHWVNDTLMYAMIIEHNSSQLIPLSLPIGFAVALEAYQKVLQTPGLTTSDWMTYTSLSRKLYQSILEPVRSQLNVTNNRLLIIPDDELYQLSFGTLLTGEVDKRITTYKNLPYLVKTHSVGYAHSLTFWNWQMNQLSEKDGLEVLGMAYSDADDPFTLDNSLRETGWHELPATAKEIKVLANLLNGFFFTGEEATEAAFKQHATSTQLIHLALHGSSADDLPRLMFRKGGKNTLSNKEDGNLYLAELFHLQLRVKLAILNACKSGKGVVSGGEVLSMARGFTYAGSENVVVNLWNTGDLPSWKLIEGFYEALDKGKPKDVSLQETVNRYLTDEDELQCHPAFWGGLVSIGNMEPLDIPSNSFTPFKSQAKLIFLIFIILCGVAILRRSYQD